VRAFLLKLSPREKINFGKRYKGASSDAVNLLNALLTFDPEKRLTAQQAVHHAFVSHLSSSTSSSSSSSTSSSLATSINPSSSSRHRTPIDLTCETPNEPRQTYRWSGPIMPLQPPPSKNKDDLSNESIERSDSSNSTDSNNSNPDKEGFEFENIPINQLTKEKIKELLIEQIFVDNPPTEEDQKISNELSTLASKKTTSTTSTTTTTTVTSSKDTNTTTQKKKNNTSTNQKERKKKRKR